MVHDIPTFDVPLLKHVVLICGCASESLSSIATPILPYLYQLADENLRLSIFDISAREEMLMKMSQEIYEGRSVNLFELYQLQRLLPCWVQNKDRLASAVLKAVTTFKDITKNSRSLKENTLQFFVRLLWILSKLTLSPMQLRDLFFYSSSVISFLSTYCSTLGSLEQIVSLSSPLHCSSSLSLKSLMLISTH